MSKTALVPWFWGRTRRRWELVSYESVPMYGSFSNKLKSYALSAVPMKETSRVTWTRVPHDATVTGALTSVTAGGPGLVAVGLDTWEANGVWTSVDGITWSRVSHDDAVFGRWPDWIHDVTVAGPGLIAVGNHSGDAAVWVSEED
jgi:hypothetical protein